MMKDREAEASAWTVGGWRCRRCDKWVPGSQHHICQAPATKADKAAVIRSVLRDCGERGENAIALLAEILEAVG